MAEVVTKLPNKGHNWKQYLDGQVWKLVQGVDYGSHGAASNAIRGIARYYAKRVTINVRDEGKTMYVQAFDK